MMNTLRMLGAISAALIISGCAGTPVALGSRIAGPVPAGESRSISSESCGFQLLQFIPIALNGRMARAYIDLEEKAAGDFIVDVEVQERWAYGFVGTSYCTSLRAKAIRSK